MLLTPQEATPLAPPSGVFKVEPNTSVSSSSACASIVTSIGELKRFSEEKRPPVGYVPFADAYIRAGRSKEAAAMIALIKSEDERLDKLEDNEQWMEAALLASKMGDSHRVREIYFACGSSAVQKEVQTLALKAGIQF